ncbi:uroporphyrinogen-III synthase [uncultured Arthrobacter sp.]|uniref:uroporphyrinogen-III synthase n=1 Tax=uncultured Arthrobacter sp. TaxID=114050 RepID=UPI00260874A6|nr:uroporphyrinogen-III synthase [uncultured Arthrobacter sp.]
MSTGSPAERDLSKTHSGSLAGITVALLRSPDRGAAMAAELAVRGAETLLVPMIDWELPADTGELDRLLDAAPSYDWLVITSVTTVRVLARWAHERRVPLPALIGSARVAAVGAATGAALEELGVAVHLTPGDDQSAEGLLACLPSEPGRALLPQSDLAADALRAGLSARGWTADTVVAYRTVDYPAAAGRRISGVSADPEHAAAAVSREELAARLRQGQVDAVVLTSPSIAARLHAMMEMLPDTVATVAIGRRTERDASALGLRIDATAALPSPAGIADAVSTAVVNHRKRN